MKKQYPQNVIWGLTAFVVIACSILFFFSLFRLDGLKGFFSGLYGILEPIVIGAVIAYLLTPVYNFITRHLRHFLERVKFLKPKKAATIASGCSIALSLVLLLLIIYGVFAMVVPQVLRSIMGIVAAMPDYIEKGDKWLDNFLVNNPAYADYIMGFYTSITTELENWVTNHLTKDLKSLLDFANNLKYVVSGVKVGLAIVIRVVKDVIIGLIVAAYLLGAKAKLTAQAKKIIYSVFNTSNANLIVRECRKVHQIFGGFISGKILDSLIIGMLCFIITSILNIPFAMLVSVVVGVTNIIPFFGPFIGAIPSAFLILLDSPLKCLYFVIVIIVLQQFDGNILGPKILGESTGLSSFWVLFAILLFGGLFGFVGMVIGCPLFAVIYSIAAELVSNGLKKRKLSDRTDDYRNLARVDTDSGEYVKQQDPTSKD